MSASVYLDVDRAEAHRRVADRPGHFMGAAMVDSQFATLEAPDATEVDVVTIDAAGDADAVIAAALASLATLEVGTAIMPLRSVGDAGNEISRAELRDLVAAVAERDVVGAGARRVLLVPPDRTRLHSRGGEITGLLYEDLVRAGCDVTVLPALGTHAAMDRDDVERLFVGRVPFERVRGAPVARRARPSRRDQCGRGVSALGWCDHRARSPSMSPRCSFRSGISWCPSARWCPTR